MKKCYILLFTVLLFCCVNLFAQPDSTVIHVFNQNIIGYGATAAQGEVLVENNGRVLSRIIDLPTFDEPMEIFAHVRIKSLGDPWDRAGTVLLSMQEMPNVELLKFITGFGVGLPGVQPHPSVPEWADSCEWQEDVSFLANLLQGQVKIKTHIDTWVNPGWQVDFWLVFKPQPENVNLIWAEGVYYDQGLTRKKLGSGFQEVEIEIPANVDQVMFHYFTSGHGGIETGDEFNKKDNIIKIDGVEVHRYQPWRSDCRDFRKYNPWSAKWGDTWSSDLSRSGWCPGDIVHPVRLDLSQYFSPGKHKIQYHIENVSNTGGSSWRVSTFLSGNLSANAPVAEKISLSMVDLQGDILSQNRVAFLRLDATDSQDRLIAGSGAKIRLSCPDTTLTFSADGKSYFKSIDVPMVIPSRLIRFRAGKSGDYTINSEDISGSGFTPQPLPLTIFNNYARQWKFENYTYLSGYPVASITATDFIGSSHPRRIADGAVNQRWTTDFPGKNSAQPSATIHFQDSTEVFYFVVKHSGAYGHPEKNISDYKIQTENPDGSWKDLLMVTNNPAQSSGNVNYLTLQKPELVKNIRIKILNCHGEQAEICELEIYNLPANLIPQQNSQNALISDNFKLFQNFPNPFNGSTTIKFFVESYASVNINIYNSLGQFVRKLGSGQLARGIHSFTWDGRTDSGKKVAAGMYFYSIQYSNPTHQKQNKIGKMIFTP